jgi:LPXTG-site transpeptidase (sortase) family protein
MALAVCALGLALVMVGGAEVWRAAGDTSTAPGAAARAAGPLPFAVERRTRFHAATDTELSDDRRADDNPRRRRAQDGRPRRDETRARGASPARGAPLKVVVPRLGMDAPVVGIDAPGGVLRPPDDPQVLGWWHSGAQPGAGRGSALITGHTVSTGGGALDDLETLRRGDRIRVRTTAGLVRYRVSRVTIYRKASLARHAARIFSQEVPGRLVLITCEDWNGTMYLSNVVVTAVPLKAGG